MNIKMFSLRSFRIVIGEVVSEDFDYIILNNPMELIEEKNGSYLLIRFMGFSTGHMKMDRSMIECETAGNASVTKRYMVNAARMELYDRITEFNNKFLISPSHENFSLH